MNKKILIRFNILYLGVFLSLIILPSLAWSQVFDQEPIENVETEEPLKEQVQEAIEDPTDEESPIEEGIDLSVEEETQDEFLPFIEEQSSEGSEDPVLENLEDTPAFEEELLVEEILEDPVERDPIFQLTVRRFEKPIFLDKDALHSCEADTFRLDISDKESLTGRIFLNKSSDIAYQVEVGSLPDGIDIRFSKNNEYIYRPGSTEDVLKFDVFKQEGAQKGNFTVPFIYTQKGIGDSSVICQLNIVNQ